MEHQRRLDELENDKFMVAKHCNALEQTAHDLEVKIQQMKLTIKHLQEEKEQARYENTVEVPKIKYVISRLSLAFSLFSTLLFFNIF